MKLVLFGNIFKEGSKLGELMIKKLNGEIIMGEEERKRVIGECRDIWEKVSKKTGGNFRGHIRFDLVPGFLSHANLIGNGIYDLGEVEVNGIYEINTEDPECTVACAELYPENPAPVAMLGKVIREEIGEKILFFPGEGIVKKEWKEPFRRNLEKELEMVDLKKGRDNCIPIWRWGGVRWNEYSEFSSFYSKWFLSERRRRTVFNTVYSPEETSPGNKSLIMDLTEGAPLSASHSLENKDNLVIKPCSGTSGKNIIFGEKLSLEEWKRKVEELSPVEDYGVFRVKWLPRVYLPGVGDISLDLNPSFWADGFDLKYLYTVVRIDEWKRYRERGTQNVAQGTAYAGAVREK